MPEQQNIEYKQSNPKIAKACFMAGYIDAWGRGTLKIYNSCKEHGLPEPTISEKEGGFMVALHKVAQSNDEGGQIGGQNGGEEGGVMGGEIGGVIDTLTDKQKEVFKLIIDNNKITYKELADKLSVNESVIGKHVKALKDKGAIERDNKTRGRWIILIKV